MEAHNFSEEEDQFSDHFFMAVTAAAREIEPTFGHKETRIERAVVIDDEDTGGRRTYEFVASCAFGPESLNQADLRQVYSVSSQVELPVDGSYAPEGSIAKLVNNPDARVVIDTAYTIDTDGLLVEKSHMAYFALGEHSAVGHVDMRDEAPITAERASLSEDIEDMVDDVQLHLEAEEVNDILDCLGFLSNTYVNLDAGIE